MRKIEIEKGAVSDLQWKHRGGFFTEERQEEINRGKKKSQKGQQQINLTGPSQEMEAIPTAISSV